METNKRSRPLEGLRILITRPLEQCNRTAELIRELGGIPIPLPLIELGPPTDPSPIDAALSRINQYDWLIFTSVNGVKHFLRITSQRGIDLKGLKCKIASVGPETARALIDNGLSVSFTPSSYLTELLARELPDVEGRRVLLVRAEGVANSVAEVLRGRGATVDEVYVYRSVAIRTVKELPVFDAVLLTSPSTVRAFKEILGDKGQRSGFLVCCIGPVTAKAAADLGLRVDVVAAEHTVKSLIESLAEVASSGEIHGAPEAKEA